MLSQLRKVGLAAVAGALCLASTASAERQPAQIPAKLVVEDNAKLFSDDAIDKAKKIISENKGSVEREVHVETYSKLSEADQKKFDEVKSNASKREAFWKEWTKTRASGEKGVVIAINYNPGHVSVIVSSTMAKFFTRDDREEVQSRLVAKFKAAKAAKTPTEQKNSMTRA